MIYDKLIIKIKCTTTATLSMVRHRVKKKRWTDFFRLTFPNRLTRKGYLKLTLNRN